MFEIVKVAVPVLVTVTVCAVLELPTAMLPKVSVLAESVNCGLAGVVPPPPELPELHPVSAMPTVAIRTSDAARANFLWV